MALIGKFLEKKFLNKSIEIYLGTDAEWISYNDSSTVNGSVVCGIFKGYDQECGIIVMASVFDGSIFYISEHSVKMIWEPGFQPARTIKTMINTGQKLYNTKYRDIM